MAIIPFTYGKYPLGHGEGGGVGNAFQTVMARVDYRDVAAAATYNLIALPAGAFVTACYFVIETAWTGSSMTMQIEESGGSATYITSSIGAQGDMTEGSVIKGHTYPTGGSGVSSLSTTLGDNDEFNTSSRTIDFVSGGGTAWTAGVGTLVVEYVIIPQ